MLRSLCASLAVAVLLASSPSHSQTPERKPVDATKIVEAIKPSLVRVEYTLQYDRSESPYGGGWKARCPGCGRYHISMADSVIAEERPVEAAGYLLTPTLVLTADPLTHERFIKDIAVAFGDQIVKASPSAFALGGSAMFLELAQPITDAKPLKFDAALKGPFHAVTYAELNGTWSVGVESLSTTVISDDAGRRYIACPTCAIVVNDEGRPVGACGADELPVDGSWKGSPMQWPKVSQSELKDMLKKLEAATGQSLPRVHLMFRSPKSDEVSMSRSYYEDPSSMGDSLTEWNGVGVLMDDSTVLVLVGLKPNVTARLERITVHPAAGESVNATFKATLKDYGALLATLESPITGAAVLDADDIRLFRNDLLLSAEIKVQGENRLGYFTHARIPGFEIGWRRQVEPTLATQGEFLFARNGELVVLPMARRQKVTVEERWSQEESSMVAAQYVREVLANLDSNIDANNVPLTEAEENRLAWLGVELQRLDQELARINKVSELTRDGTTGAVVTWVYPESPAALAGLKDGDILLRLHVPEHPKPMDIEAPDEGYFGSMGFPWDRLDEVPEEYFDQIPVPWPSANNDLNARLTQLGFGTKCTIEVSREGEVVNLPLEIVQSPAHYDSAAKFKSEPTGVTVKDMTFEVRRYLQRSADDPGVIVAEIEPGSLVSVAGLKPYELITHVNDQPVMNVGEFEKAVSNGGELRFSVKRMTRGRVVKIDMASPDAPAQDAAAPQEGEEAGVEVEVVEEESAPQP